MIMSELIQYEEKTVLQLMSGKDGLEPLIGQVKELVDGFEHDMGTAASRAKTASLAHKVAKFKTAIDGMGKDLVSDWKTKAKAVDANRKAMRDAMDELKAEARKPLDAWEAEQAKIKAEEDARAEAERLALVVESDHEIGLLLNREHDRVKQEEIDTAERLAQEAKDKADQEQKEREDLIAKEAAENARKEEEQKLIDAENKAKNEAEASRQREENSKLALQLAENNRIASEAKAVQDAIDAEERQKVAVKAAEEKVKQDAYNARIAEEAAQAKREADMGNRKKVNNGILDALLLIDGMTTKMAKEIITAMHKKQLPKVTIQY
jgi:colicin import membrane protein